MVVKGNILGLIFEIEKVICFWSSKFKSFEPEI